MSDRLENLRKAARESCAVAVWSRGVELSRAGAVTGERDDGDEATFLVSIKRGMISRTVTLYPDDAEWDCPCTREAPACEHVAAAVIAWSAALTEGEDLPKPRFSAGRVGYRLTRDRYGLALERAIVRDDGEQRLDWTLAALAAGRVDGPRIVSSQADLAVELTLGTHRHGLLSPNLIPQLFKRLRFCQDVRLDGSPVTIDQQSIGKQVYVSDGGDGFDLVLRDADAIDESFSNGIVRCDETLHPRKELGITGRELRDLTAGVHVSGDDAAELVTMTLPHLERTLTVVRETDRLPDTYVERPRVVVEIDGRDRSISVLAQVVYGQPPRARIERDRLVPISGTLPLRDREREKQIATAAQSTLGLRVGERVELSAGEAIQFRKRLADWPGEVHGEAIKRFRLTPTLVPDVTLDPAEFDATFATEWANEDGSRTGGQARPADVLRAWTSGESLVPLLDGGFAPLPTDWLERHGRLLADLLNARNADGRLPSSSQFDLAELCDELDESPPPDLQGLRGLLADRASLPEAPLPDDLQATLRDYQREGVGWLSLMQRAGLGALLADDMGLGKTVQALCALHGRSLVVAPTSVLHNWQQELTRFRPGLSFAVYHGASRSLDPDADVTLTTYAILRIDAEILAGVDWDTVVLDEAQAIKNPDSQVARAAYRLNAAHRITMTGTPIENRLEELWSQLQFLNPGLLGDRQAFSKRYVQPIQSGDDGAASALRRRVRPFVLRRLKRDVAPELPPRTDVVLRCQLDTSERELYDSLRLASRKDVLEKLAEGGNVMAVLEALLRLRQACCHGGLVPGQEVEHSSKLTLLRETLDSIVADGHKALVFSQWTSLLDRTEPVLNQARIPFLRLDGSTTNRGEVVDRFQAEEGPPVLLVSLRAGGTGINLTRADHIFLLDPWWNPAVEDQAADRAHRIGQENPVMVYRLVAEATVEEKILALQDAKRELAETALGDASAGGALTRDELLELLS
ncbi:MAG: DEAD/DEAH box helicase [Acidobacteriota bacterium]|nr:DEAD/DEAH box helicase [Acidobacteriota bacterium]MDH3784130.1 DEAD/DEAH box helicase [Acidobacteriota bacterium]